MEAASVGILMGMWSADTTSRVEETSGLPNKETAPDYLATTGLQTIERPHTAGEGEGMCDREPLRSCFSQTASIDELIMTWDNDSITASNTSNRLASI